MEKSEAKVDVVNPNCMSKLNDNGEIELIISFPLKPIYGFAVWQREVDHEGWRLVKEIDLINRERPIVKIIIQGKPPPPSAEDQPEIKIAAIFNKGSKIKSRYSRETFISLPR